MCADWHCTRRSREVCRHPSYDAKSRWYFLQRSMCCCPSGAVEGMRHCAPCHPCRPQLVKGFMQLFSVDQKRSQALEAHAAAFSTLKVCMPVQTSSMLTNAHPW